MREKKYRINFLATSFILLSPVFHVKKQNLFNGIFFMSLGLVIVHIKLSFSGSMYAMHILSSLFISDMYVFSTICMLLTVNISI